MTGHFTSYETRTNHELTTTVTPGLVISIALLHLTCYGAGNNLWRHEKLPQFRHIGGVPSPNAGRFDRISGVLLRHDTSPQRFSDFVRRSLVIQ